MTVAPSLPPVWRSGREWYTRSGGTLRPFPTLADAVAFEYGPRAAERAGLRRRPRAWWWLTWWAGPYESGW